MNTCEILGWYIVNCLLEVFVFLRQVGVKH